MANVYTVRLSQLFVATRYSRVQDDSPNVSGGAAGNDFDLLLMADGGGILGDSGAAYTLKIMAFDEIKGAAEPGLNPFAGPRAENFDAANNWIASGDDFFKEERYTIAISPTVTRGNVFHYTAALITSNFEAISIIHSDSFVLV
jgi:hypothetical protein